MDVIALQMSLLTASCQLAPIGAVLGCYNLLISSWVHEPQDVVGVGNNRSGNSGTENTGQRDDPKTAPSMIPSM